ncbi:hypothetical protein [Methylophilus sp.]|uniref:hypothetical protein n=1 Tax=Methylophilus sp. TaxID=29541 RepID=UPI000D4BB843|nr:hypothetical protein [Methylophilus sp.]PPD11735.1 MAG: hypothetical protein CTY26_07775 [Methylophilus sp.]
MKLSRVLMLLGLLLLGYGGVWYWQSLTEVETGNQQTAMGQAINQCDLIATKAAAELPEALPFQKLEKAARQSRVLDRCMQDRGYQENPVWVSEANKRVPDIAREQNISESEAFETLRREAMLQSEGKLPAYWRKRS